MQSLSTTVTDDMTASIYANDSSGVPEAMQVDQKTKVVCFDDNNLCEFHEGAILDKNVNTSDIWFQYSDLQRVKREAVILTRQYRPMGVLLSKTYGIADNESTKNLESWSKACGDVRGLERYINREYAEKRIDVRKRITKSVLKAQYKMRVEDLEYNYSSEVLSRLSAAFSVQSSRFAHMMGKADEKAVHDDEESGNESIRRLQRIPSPNSVMDIVSPDVFEFKDPPCTL